MNAVVYYLLIPFIYLLSVLPFPILYLKSDVFCFLLYHVFGYRKKVIRENLEHAFPEKTEAERRKIEKQFYRHFCDVVFEMVKLLTLSRKEAQKRCTLEENARQMVKRYFQQKKNIIWVMGHTGNWEMAAQSFADLEGYQLNVLYRKLTNPYFDKLLYRVRSRFGAYPINVDDTFREMLRCKDTLNGTVFIADQTAQPENCHWMKFLNRDTPIYMGTEVLAKKLEYVVIYSYIYKVSRGQYEMRMELITENPSQLIDNQLTETHVRLLERDIKAQPFNWLWSHRRWKYSKAR